MAHKTLIGGTAYEIDGGKTLIGGTVYEIDKGKTLVGGTVYEVGFAPPLKVTICIDYNHAQAPLSLIVNGVTYQGGSTRFEEIVEVPYGSAVTCRFRLKSCTCGEETGCGTASIYMNGVLKDSFSTSSHEYEEYESSFVVTKNTSIRAHGFVYTCDNCEEEGYDIDQYSGASVYVIEDSVGMHTVTRKSASAGSSSGSGASVLAEGAVYASSGYVQDGTVLICRVYPSVSGKVGTIRYNGVVVKQVTSTGSQVEEIYKYRVSKDALIISFVDKDTTARIDIFDNPLPYPVAVTIAGENNDYAPITIDDVAYTGNQVLTLAAGTSITCKVTEWSGTAIVTVNGVVVASRNTHNGKFSSYTYTVKTAATIHGYYDHGNAGGRIDITEL